MQFQAIIFFLMSFVLALPWWAGHKAQFVLREPVSNESALERADAEAESKISSTNEIISVNLPYTSFPVSPERDTPHLVGPSMFQKNLSARSALVVDTDSNIALYKKNIDEIRPIGSITKLLTALTALDTNLDWNKEITILTEDGLQGPMVLKAGDKVSVADLLHIGLIASSNNAINALVRSTGLTGTEFADRMNKKAEELGLAYSHFVEPTGLDQGNQSTASDIARLLRAALLQNDIQRITSMSSYKFRVRNTNIMRIVKSTDMLLNGQLNTGSAIARVVGGKTGFIDEAGYCFAMEVEGKNKKHIIVVILGSRDQWSRFSEATSLASWIFNNFQWPAKTAFGG